MSRRLVWSAALVALPILALAGSALVAPAQAAPALVKTAPAQILVNAQGMTLYVYTLDKHGKSTCTGDCSEYWPPALAPKGAKVVPSLPGVGGKFGTTMRPDGTQQLTYDGAPLYTFVKDKKPGDMTGQGAVGGTWWVVVVPGSEHAGDNGSSGGGNSGGVSPASTPAASTAATPTATGGGGGYY